MTLLSISLSPVLLATMQNIKINLFAQLSLRVLGLMASWPTGIQALPSTRYPNHIFKFIFYSILLMLYSASTEGI